MNAPRVYIQVGVHPPRAADARVAAWVEAAGATPFRVNPGFNSEAGLEVTWEELMEFDPQLVIYAIQGQGKAFDPSEFLGIEGWDKTEAAVMRRVYSVDEAALQEAIVGLLKENFGGGSEFESPSIRRLFE